MRECRLLLAPLVLVSVTKANTVSKSEGQEKPAEMFQLPVLVSSAVTDSTLLVPRITWEEDRNVAGHSQTALRYADMTREIALCLHNCISHNACVLFRKWHKW